MDSQKKYITERYNILKYREFSGIFTINDHISDNSVQINIKFTFTVHEYTNIALKTSYRMCSIKNAVLKNLAILIILIGKHLCWSLFLINLEVYTC